MTALMIVIQKHSPCYPYALFNTQHYEQYSYSSFVSISPCSQTQRWCESCRSQLMVKMNLHSHLLNLLFSLLIIKSNPDAAERERELLLQTATPCEKLSENLHSLLSYCFLIFKEAPQG